MSRAASSGSGSWYDHLPFVLLGMRAAISEDSGCCPADLLYGGPLRLPGDSFEPSTMRPLASDFAHRLRSVISVANPMPVVHRGHQPSRIDQALASASHVFLRVDAVRRPLVPPYLGPFRVLEKGNKTFIILKNNKHVTVSVDRLKPAFLLPASGPSTPSPGPRPRAPPAPFPPTPSGSPSRSPSSSLDSVGLRHSPVDDLSAAQDSAVDTVVPATPSLDPSIWPLPTRYGRRPRPPDRLNL